MTDTKHTPGPWTPEAVATVKGAPEDGPWYVFSVRDAEGRLLAAVYPEDDPAGDANARLMAEAPAMLAALREFVNATAWGMQCPSCAGDPKFWLRDHSGHGDDCPWVASRTILDRIEGRAVVS